MSKSLLIVFSALALAGCASYGRVENTPSQPDRDTPDYSIRAFQEAWRSEENVLMLSFSGGGTRAAALSYGVLKALRDIPITSDGSKRLLDEIHSISSVSGGSFTAAYFGLHGDRIFEDYEAVFLRQNVQSALLYRLLNPLSWFSRSGRTEMAVGYYEKTVFKNATFADMRRDGPLIMINASDFASGVRFSFVQEYFDLLCSDLTSFSVARAVTASSAVPILFNPIVVGNYPGCGSRAEDWLDEARRTVQGQPDLRLTIDGLASLSDHERRPYVHFVDGGITDNLGLRAFYDIVELNGGIRQYTRKYERVPPRRLVLLSVNAATDPQSTLDQTTKQPSMAVAISAMSDVQLRRYSADTMSLMKKTLAHWASEMSTPERPVEVYFILLDFAGIPEPDQQAFFNQMPTSFSLTNEQVDGLIEAGGELLRNDPEFQRLMKDVAGAGTDAP